MKTKRLVEIILAAGFILRIAGVWIAPLWYDEAFTGWLSRVPLLDMIQATAGDTHPPLYYFFTWVIGHTFGTSVLWLRIPSVIFSCAALVVFWRIVQAEKELNEHERITSLILMAVMPFQLHFAQEARQYALLSLLVLLAFYFIRRREYPLYGLVLALILYTHNYGLFYAFILFLLAFWSEFLRPVHVHNDPDDVNVHPDLAHWRPEDESKLRQVLIYTALAGLSFIPWAAVIYSQMETVSSGYWIQEITPGSIVYVLYMFFWSFGLGEKWQVLAAMLTVALSLAGLVTALKRPVYGLMAWGPLLLASAVSLIWQPVLLFRGLIASAPFLYILVAIAYYRAGKRYLKAMLAGMVAPVIVAAVYGFYIYGPSQKSMGEIDRITNTITENWRDGDVIVHANDGSMPGLTYYLPGKPQYLLQPCDRHNLGALSPVTRRALGVEIVEDFNRFERVWFVYSGGPTSTECEEEKASVLVQASTVMLEVKTELTTNGVYLWDTSTH